MIRPIVLALAGLLAGCSPADDVRTIRETRVVDTPGSTLVASGSLERFGLSRRDAASPHGHGGMGQPATPRLRGEAAESWAAQPSSSLRDPYYTAADGSVEIWVTLISGDGGGVLANVNRWRDQMGLEPVTQEAIDALPKRPLKELAAEAKVVELAGSYTPRGAEGPRAGYAFVGLLSEHAGHSVYVRMTGPADAVARERAAFDRFADTLAPAEVAPPAPRKLIDYEVPAGWKESANTDGSMGILAAFEIGEDTRCTVSAVGGGLVANVNRWRDQLGQQPLSEAAVEGLPNIEILDKPAKLIELTGTFQGMSGAPLANAMLLGVIAPGPEGLAFFVKMVGPEAVVRPHRDRFLALCASLKPAKAH